MEKLYLVGFFITASLTSLINLFFSPFYLPDFPLRFYGKLELNPFASFIKLAFKNHFYLKRYW